tara:strand:- start:153 stop:284 length:132 start_codon:yes stop_codon:yes gene_type:complete
VVAVGLVTALADHTLSLLLVRPTSAVVVVVDEMMAVEPLVDQV